jgi:hypothetical protein
VERKADRPPGEAMSLDHVNCSFMIYGCVKYNVLVQSQNRPVNILQSIECACRCQVARVGARSCIGYLIDDGFSVLNNGVRGLLGLRGLFVRGHGG